MPERINPLRMPKMIERLNQVQYVPVYDVKKGKKKALESEASPDWFDYLVHNYKSERYDDVTDKDEIPSTYVGARPPPPLNKSELALDLPTPSASKPAQQLVKNPVVKNSEQAKEEENSVETRSQKIIRMMGVNTTSENNTPTSALHLPQIMKSFLPGVSRKTPAKAASSHSSWIDLTSRRKIKQVAPNSYKNASKLQSFPRRVTLFTVNYDSDSSRKLKRRPLPPLAEAPQPSKAPSNGAPPVWLPSVSQSQRHSIQDKKDASLEKPVTSKSNAQIQETKSKALGALLGRIDRSRHFTMPLEVFNKNRSSNIPPKRSENVPAHKVIRSRHRPRRDADRQFGIRGGVVLNKLPSDLIGNVHSNFQNLEYYLGRVNEPREKKNDVVYIPTGGHEEKKSPTSVAKPYSLSEFQRGMDVRMKYAHRGSDDTPPLDSLPWEATSDPRTSFAHSERIDVINPMTSDPKLKVVKHVTINMPKVPPPSPESNQGRSKSRNKRQKVTLYQQQHCRYCNNDLTKRSEVRFPDIPTKLPPLTEHPTPMTDVGLELSNPQLHLDQTKRVDLVEKLEKRSKLINSLVNAHGEMKRRHNCPQKEVVIAPFKVTIDEDSKPETKSSSSFKTEDGYKFNRSTITKPFTFSYMSSKHLSSQKKKHVSKSHSEPKRSPPEVFNHQTRPNQPMNSKKRSIISSFVSTNQAKEIYEALINETQVKPKNNEPFSLNKETDCDGLNKTFSQPVHVKGRDLAKESILSQSSSFSDQSKQLITV